MAAIRERSREAERSTEQGRIGKCCLARITFAERPITNGLVKPLTARNHYRSLLELQVPLATHVH